jgi:uncharacterized protein YjbI with pentapeptide repeats
VGLSWISVVLAALTAMLGLGLWLRGGRSPADYTQLGAAVLGGAAVALALYVLEEDRQRATDRLVEQQSLAVQLAVSSDLRRIDLTGADLGSAHLANKKLMGATLAGANLARANLSNAGLRNAYMKGVDLTCATMADARIGGGASLEGADLDGASLQGATLTAADLRDADLREASLERAGLRGADLRGADLTGAVLTGAVLHDADLSGADLRGAFLPPRLGSVELAGARYDATTDWKGFDPRGTGAVESPLRPPEPVGRAEYCRDAG